MKIKILYEDNHLLVVEKPVNMLVQADKTKDEDLLTKLKEYIKKEYNKPGAVFLSLVHRLDRPVGGAIVYAKTSKAASRLSDQLRRRVIEREYLAIVRGSVNKNQARLENYLLKDNKKNEVSIVKSNIKGSQKAILGYKKLANKRDLSLLKVKLETGRSHQIRVQLAGIGHPLYGDQKYGSKINKVGEQIALWSYKLTFKHPTKNELIEVISDPPNTKPWNEFKLD
ncbi:MAG TPA: RluA family pseudouridine synthase [Pseudogracilibacillus sp.]|nr:RluA family pseudouridine synthase [Pseudogracilibacillus sp.]